jgi:2-haloacid dehalogenase
MASDPREHGLPDVDHPVNPDGPRRPAVLVFDVNETLSDLSPMADRFAEVGAPGHLARTWFAGVLRDGFALTAVRASTSFASIASDGLRGLFHGLPLDRGTDEAVEHVMGGFKGLEVHPDVADGVRALRDLEIRLVTLSNGSASVAEALLERAGVRDVFERLLSVEGAGIWKPAPGAYSYALHECGVGPMDAMLVAVHPWDIDGASRAGLGTAWVNRTGGPYPDHFEKPDVRPTSLMDLAALLR